MSDSRDEISLHNKSVYTDKGALVAYGERSELQPPERTILDLLAPRLAEMRMLDIGVGGGRTTEFFAPRVRSYVGVDYVPEMVEVCRTRFRGTPFAEVFSVGDVQSMPQFEDGAFDFILFSYNGIDDMALAQRAAGLREIHRVGKKGGHFCFSSHNLDRLRENFYPSLAGPLLTTGKALARAARLRWMNGSYAALKRQGLAVVREPGPQVHGYVGAAAQAALLEEAGFSNVRVFDLQGNELPDCSDQDRDWWLYYLCTIE